MSSEWKDFYQSIDKIVLQPGHNIACLLVLLLDILCSWHSESLVLVGKGIMYTPHSQWAYSWTNHLVFDMFKVVQIFFSPVGCFGASNDTYDNLVILIGIKETEAEDWTLLPLTISTASKSVGSTDFLLLLLLLTHIWVPWRLIFPRVYPN